MTNNAIPIEPVDSMSHPPIEDRTIDWSEPWSKSLAHSIRDAATLIERLHLPNSLIQPAILASQSFPLMVTESYLKRMTHGDPQDPLLLQVLPLYEELTETTGFRTDPVGDLTSKQAPGLLQKYQGRVLLMLTGVCAVHCRYCFRRHYPYETEPRRLEDWTPALNAISADPSIHEVILSGGDPLMLTDQRLSDLISRIETIPHVKRLRIHSRLPIVLPNRVTEELICMFRRSRLTPIMVVHANHPKEIADDCEQALKVLVRSGITTLNQTVLLRRVNNSPKTLVELSERLINLGVIPYYLHQLDRVQGSSHFEVDEDTGRELIEKLRAELPGYAIPNFVREEANNTFKTPLT